MACLTSGDPSAKGIFTGNAGPLTTIATTPQFGYPRFFEGPGGINIDGTVAFHQDTGPQADAIFKGNGGPLTTVVNCSYCGAMYASINDTGTVAFWAFDSNGYKIMTGDGKTLNTVVDTRGPLSWVTNPSINATGTVAFYAEFDAGGAAIFAGPTMIADTSGPFAGFGNRPAINDDGTVAFTADLDAGGEGILTGNGGPVTTVADASGPFNSFSSIVSINAAGTVAFVASLDTGGCGIFTGPDPVADKVTTCPYVGCCGLGNHAINEAGQIAFYSSDEGGIVRADPALVLEVLDPNPNLLQQGQVTSDRRLLNAVSVPSARGLAADGVTRVVLRVRAPKAGTVQLRLSDGNGESAGVGVLDTPGGQEQTTLLEIPVEQQDDGRYAGFAVLTSPADFVRPNSNDPVLRNRPIKIALTFTPSAGGSFFEWIVTLQLFRPPVILLHGLWGKPTDWSWTIENDGRFTVHTGDYSWANASALAGNIVWVRDAVRQAVQKLRSRGIAATQVDVVGHSMGGVLARLYAANANAHYIRDDNFRKGDIHKLITLDEPHAGSPLACLLVSPDNVATSLGRVFSLLSTLTFSPRPVDHGAVRDLRPDILSLPAVNVPSHALAGTGGSDLPDFRHDYPSDLRGIPFLLDFFGGLTLRDVFCDDEHDVIVSRPSQEGGLLSGQTTQLSGQEGFHSQVIRTTPERLAETTVINLLNAPLSDPRFAPEFPARTPTQGCITCGEDSDPAEPDRHDLHFEFPNGLQAVPGGTIPVTLVLPPDFAPLRSLFVSNFEAHLVLTTPLAAETAPIATNLQIPLDANGELRLRAYAFDANGTLGAADEITLPITIVEALTGITIQPPTISLVNYAPQAQVQVFGTYSDGMEREITGPALGTTYVLADPILVSVDSEGLLHARRIGNTTLTATNGSFTATATITVQTAPGDVDSNAHVDLYDYATLARCFSGSFENAAFVIPDLTCRDIFDQDHDTDIDLVDYRAFQDSMDSP